MSEAGFGGLTYRLARRSFGFIRVRHFINGSDLGWGGEPTEFAARPCLTFMDILQSRACELQLELGTFPPQSRKIPLILLYEHYGGTLEGDMIRRVIACTAIAVAIACVAPKQAAAGSDGFAAGLFGGLAAGTLFGIAASSPPPVYYVEPAPVYVPACYWTRGRPVFDSYRGIWVRPRIQVCD
jgi:hypothetical protein